MECLTSWMLSLSQDFQQQRLATNTITIHLLIWCSNRETPRSELGISSRQQHQGTYFKAPLLNSRRQRRLLRVGGEKGACINQRGNTSSSCVSLRRDFLIAEKPILQRWTA